MKQCKATFLVIVILASIAAVRAPRAEAQDDRKRIEELERKVADLERRLRQLESQQKAVPIARVGSTTITNIDLDLARQIESARGGTPPADYFVLIVLMERAFYDEIAARLRVQVSAEEIAAERTRLDRETPADVLKKIKTVLESRPGMYDAVIVRPGLISAKVKKQAAGQGGAKDSADALLKAAVADPMALSKEGQLRPKDYERLDSRTLDDDPKAKLKEWDEKHLSTLRSGQVKPEVLDFGDKLCVARLIERRGHHVVIERVWFTKGAADGWLREQLKTVELEVTDKALNEELRLKAKGYPIADRLFNR